MVSALWSGLARMRVTVSYAVILLGVTTTLSMLGPTAADRVIRHASTNLHNLNHGHVGTLLGSAFVVDAGAPYLWLPGLVCLLGVAELVWRSGRLVVAFAVGHVGATLLVAAGLAAAVKLAWLPVAITRAEDVGMSYGATAVLGTLTGALPRRWRPTWVGWWLAVGVAVVWLSSDFTDVGHAVALALGMVVATRFGEPAPWTAARAVLMVVGAAFGFLILASSLPAMMIAAVCGAAGAVTGALLGWWRWQVHRSRAVQPVAAQPALGNCPVSGA
jgi:type III secretory pathway component EscS